MVTPFHNRHDGFFTRPTKGWYTRDDGRIVEAIANERRVILRGALGDPWIYMEGARQNLIAAPTDLRDLSWTPPAAGSTTTLLPTGDNLVGVDSGPQIKQTFAPGAIAARCSASLYTKADPQPRSGLHTNIAAGGFGSWSAGWVCDDAATQLVATFGGVNLAQSTGVSYQVPGPIGDKAVRVSIPDTGWSAASTAFLDPTITMDICGIVVARTAFPLSATTTILSKSDFASGPGFRIAISNEGLISFIVDHTSPGDINAVATVSATLVSNEWFVVMFALDRAAGTSRVAVQSLITGVQAVGVDTPYNVNLGSVSNASAPFRLGRAGGLGNILEISALYMGVGVGAAIGMPANLGSALMSFCAHILNGGQYTYGIRIANGVPNTEDMQSNNGSLWSRIIRKSVDLSGIGAKTLELVPNNGGDLVWGACVEIGPAPADARFVSQPILETTSRQAEEFTIGAITAGILAVQGGPQGLRVRFQPDFASADVAGGEIFTLVYFDSGNPATVIAVFLEATGAGAIRVRAGLPASTMVSSGSITFSAGQRLNIAFEVDGSLSVTGATTGNGSFVNGTYTFPVSTMYIGGAPLLDQHAWGLISPVELNFQQWLLDGIDQLTRNSIKVTFASDGGPIDVLQFNPRGLTDALNPDNYLVTGSPGLPTIQHVQPGETGSEVVLFFDALIAPGAKVSIRVVNVVLAGAVAVPIYDGSRAAVDALVQTGVSGLTSLWEVVQPGSLGELAVIETILWAGPGPRPGINGVVIVNADPARPHIEYYFQDVNVFGVVTHSTADMESAITAVAGHLVRLRIPSALRLLTNADEYVLTFDTDLGEDPTVLSLIAFGAEVNAVAQAQPSFPRVDIANPQTERDTPQGATLGTFQVTDAGDLANDHGRAYLRKRVFRRLSTFRSGFFHLMNYGLNPPSKNLFTTTIIRRLQLDIEAQVRQEPDVVAVRANVTELRPGVVAVKLRVQDDNGSFELEGALDFTAE